MTIIRYACWQRRPLAFNSWPGNVCCLTTTLQCQENEEPANIKIMVLWQLEIEPEGLSVQLVDILDEFRGMNICSAKHLQ